MPRLINIIFREIGLLHVAKIPSSLLTSKLESSLTIMTDGAVFGKTVDFS